MVSHSAEMLHTIWLDGGSLERLEHVHRGGNPRGLAVKLAGFYYTCTNGQYFKH